MKLSNRAKKILLVLYNDPEFQRMGRSSTGWLGLTSTIKFLVREIEGEGSFYAEGRYTFRASTFNRTLLNLARRGYLNRWRAQGNQYCYYLSEEGEEKAKQIHQEIGGYIEEWEPFVSTTALYTLSPKRAVPEPAHLALNVDDRGCLLLAPSVDDRGGRGE